jgi:hypothetical protein
MRSRGTAGISCGSAPQARRPTRTCAPTAKHNLLPKPLFRQLRVARQRRATLGHLATRSTLKGLNPALVPRFIQPFQGCFAFAREPRVAPPPRRNPGLEDETLSVFPIGVACRIGVARRLGLRGGFPLRGICRCASDCRAAAGSSTAESIAESTGGGSLRAFPRSSFPMEPPRFGALPPLPPNPMKRRELERFTLSARMR